MSLDGLTEEQRLALQRLVQSTARCFYDARSIVIFDQLVRHPVLKDDDLAGRLGMPGKDLNKIIAELVNHKLVGKFTQNEQKEGKFRAVACSYYFIDYGKFCNVVKYLVSQMRKSIDTKLRNELDNKGYICPQCKNTYTPLEVDSLVDFSTGTLLCRDCKVIELIDNEESANIKGSHDRMERFNKQMAPITEGLKQAQAIGTFPAFDAHKWVHQHHFGGGAGPGGARKQELEVQIQADQNPDTQREEREAAAAARRQQNLLPEWHLKSTVSGDLTALGHREVKAQESQLPKYATTLPSTSSNASLLRTLGPVDMSAANQAETLVVVKEEEAKPVVSTLEHDVVVSAQKRYYEAMGSGVSYTPMATEEEDTKPNLDFLRGIAAGQKRAREFLDAEDPRASKSRRPSPAGAQTAPISRHSSRTASSDGSPPPIHSQSISSLPSSSDSSPPMQHQDELPTTAAAVPVLTVAGKPMAFEQITEAHHDMMTTEEYEAYFQVMMAQ